MTPSSRTIAIVGAGFSGTVVAANLLRLSYWKPLRVVLIDRAPRLARGKAYADRGYPYLLNVPAGRMSANSHDPGEFLAFAQRRSAGVTGEDFLPRALYGEYLEAVLLQAEIASPPHVRLDRVHGEVSNIERTNKTSFRIGFADGRSLEADDVVLALGNPPPSPLPGTEGILGSPRYVADPWAVTPANPMLNPGETVLVVGTGLTMADVVIAGTEAAKGRITIHAISRHGLIPPSQTAFNHAPCQGNGSALLRAGSARRLVRAVRELAEDLERQGGDWREAITFARNLAPALWQRLPTRERRRFLRHVHTYWDIHRHRLPQQNSEALGQLWRAEKLHVHAGRLVSCEVQQDRLRVTWRERGKAEATTLFVDRVVNCTGPDYNARHSRDPLMRSLLVQGMAAPDVLGLGLRTGANGSLVDVRGRTANHLYYIGPMLRADHWESTAAPELRSHAERLAHHLVAPAIRQVVAAR